MYCQKCGKEIDDKAIFCIYCGSTTKNQTYQTYQTHQTVRNKASDSKASTGLVILSFVSPMIGFIMGIIHMLSTNGDSKSAGIKYIIVALIGTVFSILCGICVYTV
ncbi:MAG: zinc-ribbon domain-containing protein, partial [Oscillospiraceae bacterium]|nr:zinc-ribbon domain-containing protein [Oscillospiraceae bacterium]